MEQYITADFHTLLKQASMTAHTYMHSAIKDIDDCFGKGYAEAHPELVGTYMQVAAIDYHASSVGIAGQNIAIAIKTVSEHELNN